MKNVQLLKAQPHWGEATTKGGKGASTTTNGDCPRKGHKSKCGHGTKDDCYVKYFSRAITIHIIQDENDTETEEKGPAENTKAKQRTWMLTQEYILAVIKPKLLTTHKILAKVPIEIIV